MNKEHLLALAKRLRGETLDETPGRDSSDALVCAREQGYRAGWNDRTRRIATELQQMGEHPWLDCDDCRALSKSGAESRYREIEEIESRERMKAKPAHRVTRNATVAEACAQHKHAVARDDGQCQCGVFFVGFSRDGDS
jgi:hypothetical protein